MKIKKYIVPLYISNNNYDKMCDMLLLKKINEDNIINSHYILITDLSKLLFNQSKAGKRLHYCRRCLQHFYTLEKLKGHILQCKDIDPQKTIFPNKKNRFINFKNFNNKIPSPFVVYADFEAFNKTCAKIDKASTEKIAGQNICSYSYKLVCRIDDKFSKPIKLY